MAQAVLNTPERAGITKRFDNDSVSTARAATKA